MNPTGNALGLCLALFLLAGAAAADEELVAGAITELKSAVKARDLAASRVALNRAAALAALLRETDAKSVARLAGAVGKAIAPTMKKDPKIALAAIEILGRIQSPGSGKLLGKMLQPPAKLPESGAELYIAAIRVAGQLHETDAMGKLEKLLHHRSTDIAVAATQALARYRALPKADRLKLLKRVVKVLGSFERKYGRSKGEKRAHIDRLLGHLRDCLAKLAGNSTPTTAGDWKVWIRTEGRRKPTPTSK